jgi:predicted phage tail component-like protein
MSDYFTFNGIDSTDFGLQLVNNNQLKKSISPSKQTNTEKVTGKDGLMIFDQTYDTRNIPLKCYLTDTSLSNVRKMMTWLGERYSQELILSYQPYKMYMALFQNELSMEEYMNGGIFTLNFVSYVPFAKSAYSTMDIENGLYYDTSFLYDSGLYYAEAWAFQYEWLSITVDTDMLIYNASNIDGCTPNIIINGSATTLEITHYYDVARTQIKDFIKYGGFAGELIIDGGVRNTFLDGTVDNETFQGEYFELEKESDNYFTLSGTGLNITSLQWDFNYIYL